MSAKATRTAISVCILTICTLSVLPLLYFILNYAALPDNIVTYFTPWAVASQSHSKNIFFALRLPAMGLLMQCVLFAVYPDRLRGYPAETYRDLASMLIGISMVVLSQFSLCPWLYYGGGLGQPFTGIITTGMLVLGLVFTVWRYIKLTHRFSPDSGKGETALTCIVRFVADGCRKKRIFLIVTVGIFMVILTLPAFRAY